MSIINLADDYNPERLSELTRDEKLNLKTVCWYHSDLEAVRELVNLEELYCSPESGGIFDAFDEPYSFDPIQDLTPIANLIRLEYLDCSSNEIASLEPLKNLPKLCYLNCSENKVESLSPLQDLAQLKALICSYNPIESVVALNNMSNLRVIHANSCKLLSLDGLQTLELEELCLDSNCLTSLEPLRDNRTLTSLYLYNNDIEDLEPLSEIVTLRRLNVHRNQIVSLAPLKKLVHLKTLYCSNNPIESLEGLEDMHEMVELYMTDTNVKSLAPLSGLQSLRHLYCSNSDITAFTDVHLPLLQHIVANLCQIESLEGLERSTQLRCVDFSRNRVKSLEPLRHLPLEFIHLSHNQIESLAPLENHTRIVDLTLAGNLLTSLDGLQNCLALRTLTVSNNRLSNLPLFVTRFRRLLSFNTSGNELIQIPLQVQNFIRSLTNHFQATIYDDRQNVHDSEVQHSANLSFQKLFEDALEITLEQAQEEILQERPALAHALDVLLSQTDVHSILNVTLKDVILYVWNRARKMEEVRELFFHELAEVVHVCFTGRAVKLLNVLSGFFPDIEIKITTNAQRNAILLQATKKATLEEAKDFFLKEMQERGETQDTIEEWMKLLCENY